MDVYREEILEHWQNPQNFGVIDKPDLVIEQVNPLCGDEVTFYFRLSVVGSHPSTALRMTSSSLSLRAHPSESSDLSPSKGQLSDRGQSVGQSTGKLKTDKLQSDNRKQKTDNRKILDVSFTGSGCAISTASASILSEKIKGMSLDVISKITGEDVFKLLGGPVAPARLKCAFLPLEAVRRVMKDL